MQELTEKEGLSGCMEGYTRLDLPAVQTICLRRDQPGRQPTPLRAMTLLRAPES
jgi:hypothetical protein